MSNWIDYESDTCKAYVASIGKFKNWTKYSEIEEYLKPKPDIIEKVEKLFIFSHQPVYNNMSKQNAFVAKDIRIFNTGRFSNLMPEVSGLYYIDI